MRSLVERYRDDLRVTGAMKVLATGADCVLGSVHGGLNGVLVAALHTADAAWSRVVVANDPDGLAEDLEELGLKAAVLPELDEFEIGDGDGDGGEDLSGLSRRRAALEHYAAGGILCASARAVQQPVPDLANLLANSLVLAPGDEQDLHHLAERLADEGYHVVQTVEGSGELAVRGGLLDVWPWTDQHPVRVETFGDEIESLRSFDPFTQESVAKRDSVQLLMAKDHLATGTLWQQIEPGAFLVVLGDLPLRGRMDRSHPLPELRFARQLEAEALDGASVGIDRFLGDLHRDLAELALVAAEGCAITVLARNEEAAADLTAALADHGIAGEVLVGRLSHGWRDAEVDRLLVHDFELAHRRPVRKRRVKVGDGMPLSSLSDLKPNDYVVHLNHGIARFKGMATLEKRGYLEDFLQLEFAEESRLYTPVSAIDLIQKYIGGAGRHPPLSTIGSKLWKRKKEKAQKSVEDLTAQLLDAQAKRLSQGGHACAVDDRRQRRFEAAFPYEETSDQLAAMREIKADMEGPAAMDRLLCGDVGFGKTELAMRAAYKMVENRKQVALLAPTTILAEQHAATFHERFEGTAVEIRCLNRFRKPAERREILAATAASQVDILIGTHALLGNDLKLPELGLLIVDEEQRFGVKHKERLKILKIGIDVLTLSATPIPRTLHQGMTGLRDVSVLAEAPAERLAVATRVAPFDRHLIGQAIKRELERDGQVFVVHNRVKDIESIAHKIERAAPGARIDIVHGQMHEDDIGSVMKRFHRGEIQVLVATSIVESGLDIPNANTLIVNNAHAFGLGELHQLRGRIGRFTKQAYAYFLVPRGQDLGEDARSRLDAIQEYAELGAGFKLAMRDLELRGAGNLLGGEQSGHIEAIGYELYCRLLADAVARLEGRAGTAPTTVTSAALTFPVDAYVPDTYCEAATLKFELHKTIDGCGRMSELVTVFRTTRDRFGAPPPPLSRLFRLKAIRLRCAEHGILRATIDGRQLRLQLHGEVPELLIHAQVPEAFHLQAGDKLLVLFLRQAPDQDTTLDLLSRLLRIDLRFD